MNATREYQRLRKLGWHAKQAWHHACIKARWYDYEWSEIGDPEIGDCRLRIEWDMHADLENLKGDCFNPKVNPDIPASRLEREERDFEDRVAREGVVGVIGEYWDGDEWQHADSCWGFVGDDWRDSGCDTDIMRATMNAADTVLGHLTMAPDAA